ncbi:helicase-related protein [Agromyces sp. Marseille-Q5079]|uniref:helicase-related protein n=1 Tax=Agromyces sp. Marseille-Q5079 TaxID=3439059 RepID=UPI003D9CA037
MPSQGLFDSISQGDKLAGVIPGAAVEVIMAIPHGGDALQLIFRGPDGNVAERILYRHDEEALSFHREEGRPVDGDPQDYRLAAEAQRILLAGYSDPMLAVSTSNVQPLPHQIRAVYGEMLPRTPLRFLLADDPGAGKTIMAGLYIKELLLRDDVKRCLIVAPGSLVEQWQDELRLKFGLDFEILASGSQDAGVSGSVFESKPLLIARMDQLARNDHLHTQLEDAEFDLVVVDEAHRMSARWFGGEIKVSRRFQLGVLLSERARHLLLMTATPHNGKEEDFQSFLSLLDRDRFEGPGEKRAQSGTADGFMRRMVKEDLLTFEGKPLFPERQAETASYPLSLTEAHLYNEVTEYVREGMNRADRLDGKRRVTVGFALTVLQRRLASSPEAIYQSLRRRADRLERKRQDLLANRPVVDVRAPSIPLDDDPDLDEFDADELESVEEELVDAATAAATAAELETEVAELAHLAELARRVLESQQDSKWVELRGVLEGHVLERRDGTPRKLIVFTEHRDTLNYLEGRIGALIDRADAVVAIHGGVHRLERRRITEEFTHNPDVQVLVATDAAGEGLNLHAAHLMVNYDLPWNPNRIEQRFGRIHRIGQTEVCRLWNMVAEGTREGEVFRRLLDKINEQRRAYGGKVFDVLGTSLGEMSLTKLLRDAIRYGEQPAVRAKMFETIDAGVAKGLEELMDDHALAHEALPLDELARLRGEMEDARARRLQPHFIRDAFVEAFTRLGGRIERRERGRYEITHVPATVRETTRAPIARRYHRITFDITTIGTAADDRAELLAPGHPLHDAVLRLTVQKLATTLDRGTVLANAEADAPALLVGVLNEVQDATGATIAQRFGYVLTDEDGAVIEAGPAPYLDYSPPTPRVVASSQPWLAAAEQDAKSWVIAEQLPAFTSDIITRRTAEYERLRDRVRSRLNHEIRRLDSEALKADSAAREGKRVRTSGDLLRKRAGDLTARLDARLELIDKQLKMAPLPPKIVSVALVVPGAVEPPPGANMANFADLAAARKAVERRGVDAVLAAERALGRAPVEQAFNNPGFDVLTSRDDEPSIRIEVKARILGADTFTITRTEVLTALNVAPNHRLALVSVHPDGPAGDRVHYIGEAFEGAEPAWLNDFGVVAQTLDWDGWWARGRAPF